MAIDVQPTGTPPAAQPLPLPTRLASPKQVTAGSLATRTIRIWWQNLWRFTALIALLLLPVFVLGFVAAIAIPNLAARGVQLEGNGPAIFALALVLVGVFLPLSMTFIGALNYGVVQHLAGRRVGVGAMLKQGARRIWPLLAVLVLVVLATAGGYVLLVVPGIMIAIATSVALPAVMMETVGPTGAFRRSLELTRGYRWSILGAFFLVGLVQVGANIAANVAGVIHPALAVVAAIVVLLPASSLTWLVPAVAYHDLRVAKEGVDTSALAKVFE